MVDFWRALTRLARSFAPFDTPPSFISLDVSTTDHTSEHPLLGFRSRGYRLADDWAAARCNYDVSRWLDEVEEDEEDDWASTFSADDEDEALTWMQYVLDRLVSVVSSLLLGSAIGALVALLWIIFSLSPIFLRTDNLAYLLSALLPSPTPPDHDLVVAGSIFAGCMMGWRKALEKATDEQRAAEYACGFLRPPPICIKTAEASARNGGWKGAPDEYYLAWPKPWEYDLADSPLASDHSVVVDLPGGAGDDGTPAEGCRFTDAEKLQNFLFSMMEKVCWPGPGGAYSYATCAMMARMALTGDR
ncbi:hypothetical protein JCM8097_007264 [Rhodosporidiobolus ruineniae]